MKEILILGSLPKDNKRTKLYQAMSSVCKQYAKRVSSPIDTAAFKGSDRRRYQRAFKKVHDANLIIGELSEPSTGEGIELGWAAVQKKSIIIVARRESSISALVKGCPMVQRIVYYKGIADLKTKLKNTLDNHNP